MCSPSIVHALLRLPTATDFNERARCTACRSESYESFASSSLTLSLFPDETFLCFHPRRLHCFLGRPRRSCSRSLDFSGLDRPSGRPVWRYVLILSVRLVPCIPSVSLNTMSRLFPCFSRRVLICSLLRGLDLCTSSPSINAAVRTEHLILRPYFALSLCSLLWQDWSERQFMNNESQVVGPLVGPFNLTIWSNTRCDNGTCTVFNLSTSPPNQEPVRSCLSEPLVRRLWLPR